MSSLSDENKDRASPPFGPPDCVWREMKPDTSLPGSLVEVGGTMKGDPVYIGRVYHNKALHIGTAIPEKGICLFLDNNNVETSSLYEILTVECGNPLVFQQPDLDSKLLFKAGKNDKDDITYVGRFVDGDNTYIGWIDRSSKSLFIPRDQNVGPSEIQDGYEIMIHQFLDRLCICPPCIPRK